MTYKLSQDYICLDFNNGNLEAIINGNASLVGAGVEKFCQPTCSLGSWSERLCE